MLIPIGQEHETRRMPWVSAAIIVMLVFVFLVLGMGSLPAGRLDALDSRVLVLNEYLVDHPYLETPPDLGSLAGGALVERMARERKRYLASSSPPEAAVLHAEQARLREHLDALGGLMRGLPAHDWGFVPARPRFRDAFTSMFVHGGWLHLLGNLLAFFVIGPYLEEVWGRVLFALLYLSSGLVAAYAHGLRFPDSHVPLVGASGAIAGVMGAFLVRLGASKIKFLFLPIWFLPRLRFTFLAPAFIVLPLWFVAQLAEAHDSGGAGVAYWAHIGGFCFGAAVALSVRLTRLEENLIRPRLEASDGSLGPPARGRAKPVAWPAPLEEALARNDEAEAMGHAEQLLSLYAGKGDVELATTLMREMKRRMPEALTPGFALSAAGFLERQGDAKGAIDYYRRIVEGFPSDPASLRALIRIGELSKRLSDFSSARSSFEAARQHPSCPPATASYLREQLDELPFARR